MSKGHMTTLATFGNPRCHSYSKVTSSLLGSILKNGRHE